MEDLKAKRLFDMYSSATDFSAFVPDSIRYPPNAIIPKGLVNAPKLKEKLSACMKSARIAKKEVNPESVRFVCKQVKAKTEIYMGEKKILKIINE